MPLRRGIGVSSGVVIGDALVLETEEARVPRRIVPRDQIDHEISVSDRAFESARKEVASEREQFASRAGSDLADIFGFHERWLGDVKPRKEIAALIRRRHPEVDEALRGPERRSHFQIHARELNP